MITLTATVGESGAYLITGTPITSRANSVLKFSFVNNTFDTTLLLMAGDVEEFSSGTGGLQLAESGGPGDALLTITDTHALAGKVLFVRRVVGMANSQFTLTVD